MCKGENSTIFYKRTMFVFLRSIPQELLKMLYNGEQGESGTAGGERKGAVHDGEREKVVCNFLHTCPSLIVFYPNNYFIELMNMYRISIGRKFTSANLCK